MFKHRVLPLLALVSIVFAACAPAAPSPTPAPAKPAATTAPAAPAATTAPAKPAATTAPAAPAATTAPAAKPAATTAPAAPAAPKPTAPLSVKPGQMDKFVYGIVSYNMLHTVIMVANEKKWFEKYGIDLELVLTQSAPAAVAGLVGGSVDLTTTTVESAFPMQAQNPDVKIVAGFFRNGPYTLLSAPNINSIADLKGKTMGSTALKAGADTVALRTMLLSKGLVDEKDYTIIVVGSVAERLAALKAGTVSAVANLEPQVSDLKAAGFKVLDEATNYPALQDIYTGILVAKQSNYKAKPDLFNRFLRGYIEAVKFVNNPANKAEVTGILVKLLKTKPEFADNTYNKLMSMKAFPAPPVVVPAVLQKTVDNSKKLETPGIPANPMQFVDNTLIEQAAKDQGM